MVDSIMSKYLSLETEVTERFSSQYSDISVHWVTESSEIGEYNCYMFVIILFMYIIKLRVTR